VPQDAAARELGLLNDTNYELCLLDDEDDCDTDIEWTFLKTALGLTNNKMGLSSELDFNEF
jgi:hypothetical protein